MALHDNALLELARQIRPGLPHHPDRFREALEDTLVPIIRCALRTGTGNPVVVRWVRERMPPASLVAADLSRTARVMGRALCDQMLQRLDPLPCRETVAS
jgi:hypothetical protein